MLLGDRNNVRGGGKGGQTSKMRGDGEGSRKVAFRTISRLDNRVLAVSSYTREKREREG